MLPQRLQYWGPQRRGLEGDNMGKGALLADGLTIAARKAGHTSKIAKRLNLDESIVKAAQRGQQTAVVDDALRNALRNTDDATIDRIVREGMEAGGEGGTLFKQIVKENPAQFSDDIVRRAGGTVGKTTDAANVTVKTGGHGKTALAVGGVAVAGVLMLKKGASAAFGDKIGDAIEEGVAGLLGLERCEEGEEGCLGGWKMGEGTVFRLFAVGGVMAVGLLILIN